MPRFALLCLLLASYAFPESPKMKLFIQIRDLRAVCEGDVMKVCEKTPKEGGAFIKCALDNEKKYSKPCQTKMSAFREKNGDLIALFTHCNEDAQKQCGGFRPGDGQLLACLKSKKDQISADCKKQIALAR